MFWRGPSLPALWMLDWDALCVQPGPWATWPCSSHTFPSGATEKSLMCNLALDEPGRTEVLEAWSGITETPRRSRRVQREGVKESPL